ncbi:MAG: hypothetical protein JXR73_11010 [Candidatus Omnitrophica bacterium]|nr:hypothetical protein [Candidatus Omnitrophota bacterium]
MGRMRFWLNATSAFFLAALFASNILAATVSLHCPQENPLPPIRSGLLELERIFQEQGWSVRRSFGALESSPGFDLQIRVLTLQDAPVRSEEAKQFQIRLPAQAESYAILKKTDESIPQIIAMGRDATGAMYAAFELAEQIEPPGDLPIEQRIVERAASPSIPNRGVLIMLHKQALEDPFSWLHSDTFWKDYCRQLARSRFNYVELQGVYDLSTAEFSNVLPYLTTDSGMDASDVERNQQSLQRIIHWAHEYGLFVALINSGLDWKGKPAREIDRRQLERSTQSALSQVLQRNPRLDGVGFMLDDAALPTEFYRSTYLKAIVGSVGKPTLMLHAWAADPDEMIRFIEGADQRSVLEVKFNGDQLALPYPATGGRMRQWAGYSYRNYIRRPRKNGLLFQIAFNGTHRIFPWGDPDFIRRTLGSAADCGADGFVLQTFSTYMPHADAYTNPVSADLRYFDWTYQRDWYWRLMWGRLAYERDAPDTYFEQKFQAHFGDSSGALLFGALRRASQAAPALAATCFQSPDFRDFAPEWLAPARLEEIQTYQPLDSFSIRSVSEEIEFLIGELHDGRHSPLDLLDQAAKAAEESVHLARQAGDSILASQASADPDSRMAIQKEWKSWLLDFQSLAVLGTYWRDQLSAAVQAGVYQRTGDIPSLILASEKLNASAEAWAELQELTRVHYRFFGESHHPGGSPFHWSRLPSREKEDKQWITQLYNDWLNQSDWPSQMGHFPLTIIPAGAPALLTLSIPPKIKVRNLFVQYQNQQGETARAPLSASQLEGVYYAEIAPSALAEGDFQYFFLGERADDGDAWVIPSGKPPFSVVVSDDNQPPSLIDLQHSIVRSGQSATISAKIADPGGVDSAVIWWKRFPADAPWTKAPMNRHGDVFRGTIPLTQEGANYAIEAVDRFGNSIRLPDMRSKTPYRIISPFE